MAPTRRAGGRPTPLDACRPARPPRASEPPGWKSEGLRCTRPTRDGGRGTYWPWMIVLAPTPARHLLRAKDLIDAHYARTARRGRARSRRSPLPRAFQPRVPARVRRDAAPVPADTTAGARGGTAPVDGPIRRRHLLHGRAAGASARSRRASGAPTACSPTAYRAAHPPAADGVRIPTCVLLAYGAPAIQHVWRRQAVSAWLA